jgi:uncharacterized protein (DUF2147 family)
MRVTAIFISALLGAGLIVGGTAWGASDPRGVWIDDKGRGGVEIKDCGANLCGHIVWARDEADSDAVSKSLVMWNPRGVACGTVAGYTTRTPAKDMMSS